MGEDFHAFGGRCLDDMYPGGNFGWIWVDVIDGNAGSDVVEERSGGIDGEGGADNDKNVGLFGNFYRRFEHGDCLLEEDDVGADMVALNDSVGGGVEASAVVVGDGEKQVVAVDGAYLHELAVEVEHL